MHTPLYACIYIHKFTYFLKVVSLHNPQYTTIFCFPYPGFKVNRQVGPNVSCFFPVIDLQIGQKKVLLSLIPSGTFFPDCCLQ